MESIVDFLKSKYGIDSNTATTLVVTLLITFSVLILSKILDVTFTYITDCKSRKVYRTTFRDMVKSIFESCAKQAPHFIEFSKQLNIQYAGQFKLISENIDLLKNFQNISFDVFYSAYYKGIENWWKGNRLERVRKTFSITESLSNLEIKIPNDIIEFNVV